MRALPAERLLPGEGDDIELGEIEALRERRRGGVANGETFAVGGDPVAVGHAHAGSGAVPGEHHVAVEIDFRQIGQLAIGHLENGDILELELFFDVGDPAFAERFPSQHGHRPGAEQRPQRQFNGAGVGGRHDSDAVIGGDLEHLAGQIDGALELRLADLGSVRARKNGVGEGLQAPARALGAGAGRKVRNGRPHAGLLCRHGLPFQIGAPRWGGVSHWRR